MLVMLKAYKTLDRVHDMAIMIDSITEVYEILLLYMVHLQPSDVGPSNISNKPFLKLCIYKSFSSLYLYSYLSK